MEGACGHGSGATLQRRVSCYHQGCSQRGHQPARLLCLPRPHCSFHSGPRRLCPRKVRSFLLLSLSLSLSIRLDSDPLFLLFILMLSRLTFLFLVRRGKFFCFLGFRSPMVPILNLNLLCFVHIYAKFLATCSIDGQKFCSSFNETKIRGLF